MQLFNPPPPRLFPGEWRIVIVDDCLPCVRGKVLAYGGARKRQLWVPLIEKAFAKLVGSYEAIEGGSVQEVGLFTLRLETCLVLASEIDPMFLVGICYVPFANPNPNPDPPLIGSGYAYRNAHRDDELATTKERKGGGNHHGRKRRVGKPFLQPARYSLPWLLSRLSLSLSLSFPFF